MNCGKREVHIFKDSLHECDGDFGLLNEVIFRILNFKPGLFLFLRAGVLKAVTRSRSPRSN